ncbi:hypothetical protein KIM372_13960 [Bombiscardovia nodaiensis]|uniref:Uncharacterized protein n=1 Tax=Bombiscardovia nodaiensis TaxID=2932181 RepID=A0ABN6SBK7_9BIFI|nr:hypothetical protein KIM372_13960 [Bombiscardovia nodaiensis]
MASLYRFLIVALALTATAPAWLEGIGRAWVPLDTQADLLLALVMLWAAAGSLLKGIEPPAWLKGFASLYVWIGAGARWALEGASGLLDGPRIWGIPVSLTTRILLPALVALDFLLFDTHRRYSWHYTLTWMTYLPCYLAFVLVRAAIWPTAGAGTGPQSLVSPYPYPGLNLQTLGWERLSVNAAEYLVVCFAAGLALFLIDRILPARTGLSVSRR